MQYYGDYFRKNDVKKFSYDDFLKYKLNNALLDLEDYVNGSVRNTVQKPNPNFNIENKSKLFSSFINSINFFHLIIL